jgi:hypothetical protein
MRQLNDILRLLEDGANLPLVRRAVLDLILHQLHALQAVPMHWEKAHFANAVAALGMNIHSIYQPTDAWLRLALVDFQKAVLAIKPETPYRELNRHLDMITLEELIATVETLKLELTDLDGEQQVA